MVFRRRDYPELLEGMLTSLAGGVTAEAHPYPPPGAPNDPKAEFRSELMAPLARRLVGVHGARNGASFRFREGSDVALSADGAGLIWMADGARPDPGSLVEISYLRRGGASSITDIEVGGVARTIVEAVALEAARIHAELQAVYESAFVETATGRALDNVVALVGVERVPAGRARATLTFTRDPNMPGAITIPAGTRAIDAGAKTEYETVETVTLSSLQNRIDVEARDVEAGNAPVLAGILTVLPVPIAGIVAVTNNAPAARAQTGETDAELRTRARAFLQGSERGTVGALRAALARQGVRGEIVEPSDRPGVVEISPVAAGLSPEAREQLLAAIEDARPAGVRVEMKSIAVPVKVDVALEIQTGAALSEPARRAAQEQIHDAVDGYFADLSTSEDARVNQIVGLVLAVPGVEDVTLVSAAIDAGEDVLDREAGLIRLGGTATALGELSIADPSLPTRADLRIVFPADQAAPDRNLVSTKIEEAFAYLTERAAVGDVAAIRTLSFEKLLLTLPTPPGSNMSLAAYDTAPDPKPELPTDAGAYELSLFIEQANGLTRILSKAGDAYLLSPHERLALGSLQVEAEA